MRPTRDALVTALLAGLLSFVAFNLQAGWVYAVVALLVALLAAGALTAAAASRGISVVRVMPDEVGEGDRIAVTLELKTVRWPRVFVEVLDAVPGLERAGIFVPILLPGRVRSLTYQTTALRRGEHRGGAVTFRSQGLAGLFRASKSVDAPASLTIFPRYWTIKNVPLPGHDRAAPEIAPSPSRSSSGTEFHGLREYREGDGFRRVHWRSTAKRGQLIVREFEDDATGKVTLLLDSRLTGTDDAGFEDLIRAAASVAHHLTRSGTSVRIIAAQPDGVLDVGGGWRDAAHALARVRASDLPPAFAARSADLPPHSAVVLFTSDASAAAAVSRRGHPVIAVDSLASLVAG